MIKVSKLSVCLSLSAALFLIVIGLTNECRANEKANLEAIIGIWKSDNGFKIDITDSGLGYFTDELGDRWYDVSQQLDIGDLFLKNITYTGDVNSRTWGCQILAYMYYPDNPGVYIGTEWRQDGKIAMDGDDSFTLTSQNDSITFNRGSDGGDVTEPDSESDDVTPVPLPVSGLVPVYRLYNDALKAHLYTTAKTEKAYLESVGWLNEGVAWNAYAIQEAGTLPVYRFYNTSARAHHYTLDENEKSIMLETSKWRYEGIAWYAYPSQHENTAPIYRFYSIFFRQHLFTADVNETQSFGYEQFWSDEGIGWYSPVGDMNDTVQVSRPARSIEIQDTSVSVGGIVQTKDQKSGIVIAGSKDDSGKLVQMTDITLISDINNPNDNIHMNIDYTKQEVSMVTSDRNFVTIDHYDPIEKTVSITEGKINPDGTKQSNSQIEEISVGSNFETIVTPGKELPNPEDWIPELKGKGKAIFKLGENFAPSPVKGIFSDLGKGINVEINPEDQVVINNFSSLGALKDNFFGWIDCLKKNWWGIIGCLSPQIKNFFDAIKDLFDTYDGTNDECCYALQELCREWGGEIYMFCGCTASVRWPEEGETVADVAAPYEGECEAIGGSFEAKIGGSVTCKMTELKHPSECE